MALTKGQRKKRLVRGDQDKIARELRLSPATVSLVLNGKTQLLSKETVKKVRAAIAERIGESVVDVFGTAA